MEERKGAESVLETEDDIVIFVPLIEFNISGGGGARSMVLLYSISELARKVLLPRCAPKLSQVDRDAIAPSKDPSNTSGVNDDDDNGSIWAILTVSY